MRVLVLGAGFGGLELATTLSERLGFDVEVTLVDQSEGFVFGFSKLDVMFGRRPAHEVFHPYRDIEKPGVRFVQSVIRAIDPGSKRVETDAGTLEGDVLVLALGADLDPSATPGLLQAGHEFYTPEGAFALRDVLAAFPGGRVVVGVTSTPFKCPPAPSETALLMHDFLTERGIRTDSSIALVMPFGVPIPLRRRLPKPCWLPSPSGGSSGVPTGRWPASTLNARWQCSPTVTRCRSTSSWGCRATGCPMWSRRPV